MCWTQYSTAGSISAQSSQEECPEAMVDLDGAEQARNHALLTLEKTVDTKAVKPTYRCAKLHVLIDAGEERDATNSLPPSVQTQCKSIQE